MKIIFNTKDFISKIKNIAPTAEVKQTLTILGNLVVRVKGNMAYFSASDLEIEVFSEMDCDSEGDVDFTIPAKKLLEILSALSSHETVTVNVNKEKADITAGKSKISLPTLPIEDYPSLDNHPEESEHKISKKELMNLINKTSFAMAYQDARHFLNGLHLCSNNGKLVAVCTDGHRLAKYESSDDASDDLALIIPRKAITEINRILQSFNDNNQMLVTYSYNSKNFTLKMEGYKIITKLIEGNFPNFNKVIPEDTKAKITIDKTTLKNSLNIISKVVNQQYKGVKLTPEAKTMHLITSNTESEVGEDQIDVLYNGDPMSVGFNISYLQDVIDVISGENIDICINDQNSGCLIRGDKDSESIYVIMPMRV